MIEESEQSFEDDEESLNDEEEQEEEEPVVVQQPSTPKVRRLFVSSLNGSDADPPSPFVSLAYSPLPSPLEPTTPLKPLLNRLRTERTSLEPWVLPFESLLRR